MTMLNILQDLKKAGADLTTPHAYNSSTVDVLAIRSPAVRLVQEFCITLLRPYWHRIGVDSMVHLTALLSSLELRG